ncbi:MAG: non-ribosomal peptide synthetase, partial [Acidobacteria bacterium]|nr:non-ribosomal peptide synthetase [Acidobacteriota bacterium]
MPASYCQRIVESFESRTDRVGMRIVGVPGSEVTFGEMLRQVRGIAANLQKNGIQPGDRVVLIGENHPNWALAYLGTLFAGAVVVPLDPHGEIETLTNFLQDSEAKLAFLDREQVGRFADIHAKLGREVPTVVWNSAHGFGEWIDTTLAGSEFPAAVLPEDIAVLMYTSGTTGKPKGVPLTHGNILAELEGVNYVLELTEKEKILSLLPLFHAYLQIVNLWIATVHGCEVGYLKELSPAELSSAMKEFKPTILTTVPRLWYLFHKKIFDAIAEKPTAVRTLFRAMLGLNGTLRNIGVNLGRTFFGQVHEGFGGRLRLAISAGSRFDEAVAIDFHKLGFTILQGYGLTETSGAATATRLNDNRVGSVGTPMHGAEVKINEPNSEGVGEVLIRGPIVFAGYYHNETATAEAFTEDGWFRSGDLGRFDKGGHLYIVGRAKDVIVLPSGKNVHPEDLETHYLKCPLIAELAVIGVADENERSGAEKLAAIVVPDFDYLRKEKIANSGEAIRHALDNLGRSLPEYQRVRDYVIRAEPLPRTATRKIKRFQLKQEVESGLIAAEPKAKTWTLSPADAELLATSSGKTVIAAIRQNAADTELVHPAMNLEIDLGLDSLARAETFATLEHAYSTEFTADEAAEALTVAAVIDLVDRHGGADSAEVSLDLNWGKIVRETNDEFPEVQWILRDRPAFALFAWSVYKVFNLFCRLFMRLEVQGGEHLGQLLAKVDNEAAEIHSFIICPNHQS